MERQTVRSRSNTTWRCHFCSTWCILICKYPGPLKVVQPSRFCHVTLNRISEYSVLCRALHMWRVRIQPAFKYFSSVTLYTTIHFVPHSRTGSICITKKRLILFTEVIGIWSQNRTKQIIYRMIKNSLCTWRLQYKRHAKIHYFK